MIRSDSYRALYVLQTTLAGVFQLLLARLLGASSAVDAYFVAIAILMMAANFGNFFSDTFLPLYHDVRARDRDDAAAFYRSVLAWSLLVGVCLLALMRLSGAWLVRAFAWGLEPTRQDQAREILGIVALALVAAPATRVNNLLLNAELYFAPPYLIAVFGHLANLLALLAFGRRYGVQAVAVATAASSITGLVVQQLFIARRLAIRPGFRLRHPRLRELARTSLSVRLGHQVYNLKDWVSTTFLSLFPPGTISLFNYAFRLSRVLFGIANSAPLQIFSSTTAQAIAELRFDDVRVAMRRLLLQNLLWFSLISLPVALVLPWVLERILGPRLGHAELDHLWAFFVSILPYHLVLAAELPLVQTTIALKNGALIFRVNVRFILLLVCGIWLLRSVVGIYAVPAALALAQIWNAVAYLRFVHGKLKEVHDWGARSVALTFPKS